MNIAMFTDAYWPRVNGVTVSVDTFSLALVKAGHKVMIICPQYPVSSMTDAIVSMPNERRDPARKEVKILQVPSFRVFFSKEDRVAKVHKRYWVERELNAFAPDVIHVNTEFVIGDIGFSYAKKWGLPAVYTFHTIWEDYALNYFPFIPELLLRFGVRHYLKIRLKRSDLVIVPTDQVEEKVRNYHIKKEIRQLPTGIDPDLFRHSAKAVEQFRRSMEEEYPVIHGKRILLFAGRVAKEKNLSFIIQLFPELLAEHPDLVLMIVGSGPWQDDYLAEAQSCGVGDNCIFTGYMGREKLSLIYAISHVFVMPSLTETQGLVTIEAMLSEIPVVAIGAMGTVHVMGGDRGGFMVRNDRAEFKERVLQLLNDDDLYRRKSEEARLHAQRWTIGSITEQLVEIYRDSAACVRPLPHKKQSA
ncbi:MAG: glycosyltransferase [Spirochaetaceae bacterium]|jgi:glycosyltransferase involved in cell wall biosynthesis|nr:glycosyltransferase [Spirochaetaceae bacterium]